MQIAVTGGSGFIGSHVVDKLIDADHTVSVLDLKEPHRADVTHKAADLLDCGSVSEALKGTDAVYHLAAMANVNDVFANPQLGVKLNIDGTINVLESARKNDLKRVILASTVWVYAGANTIEVNEKSPFYMPGAGHVYTTTKIASEFLCHDYKELYGVDFTILRYGIPYGPRARSGTVIPIFIKQVMNNKPITILGDGSQYR